MAYLKLETDDLPALAFIELSSISRGLFLTDTVLKKAQVRIIASQPISSGKHGLLFMGDVASVTASYEAALELGEGTVLRNILIPGVHENLAPFLNSLWSSDGARGATGEAVGIVESLSLAGAVLAADQALKTADVSLCRMRLGQGIGGKAYFVITGRQSEVEAALDAARESLNSLDSFCRMDAIPRPSDEAMGYF
jgi:microcompartment protein CcmL/EutN